ncbi:MAG: hypothetical protein ABIG28_00560, partial [archaeon]
MLYENEFPFLKLPKNKENLIRAIITNASDEDLEKIKKSKAKIKSSFVFGNEYYYQTKDFVSLSNRNFRKAINKFK